MGWLVRSNPGLAALGRNRGEPLEDPVRRPVADVEVRARRARLVHHLVDAARDDVARRQRAVRVVVEHELAPAGVHQPRALAAQRLRQQEPLAAVIERRRVELHELHVEAARARPVRHRHAVAAGPARVRRVQVDAAQAAGREDGLLRQQRLHLPGRLIEDVCADAGRRRVDVERVARVVGEGEQIHRGLSGEDRRARLAAHGREHGLLDGAPGAVGVMDDAREGVRGLGREVKLAARQAVERHTGVVDQELLDQARALAAEQLHRRRIAEAGASRHDVGRQPLRGVAGPPVDDAALRLPGVGVLGADALGQHDDAGAPARRGESRRASGQAAPDHEDVDGCAHESKSNAMSTDGAEWVRAPTEMVSTPASAYARTFASVMPPDDSTQMRVAVRPAAHRSNGDGRFRGRHVVEQHRARAGIEGFAQLLERIDLDLNHDVAGPMRPGGHLSSSTARAPASSASVSCASESTSTWTTTSRCAARPPPERRGDAAGRRDMVVLDQHRVVQAEAVVPAAADADRVLLEETEPGRGLARVGHRRARAGHGVHVAPRHRRHARQPLQQVEREPLAREDRRRRPGEPHEPGRALDARPVVDLRVRDDARVEFGEHRRGDRQPGDDARLARDDPPAGRLPGGHGPGGRDVAAADVLLEEPAHLRADERRVEARRGHALISSMRRSGARHLTRRSSGSVISGRRSRMHR